MAGLSDQEATGTESMMLSHSSDENYFSGYLATIDNPSRDCQVQPAFRVDLSLVNYTK